MKKLLLLLLLSSAALAHKPIGTETDDEHVVGPAGTPIHKVYWEYLKSQGYTKPITKDEEKFDLNVMWIPELTPPPFMGGMWIKERWVDENKKPQAGYYVDRATGFLYRENKTPIRQKYAKKAKLKGYSKKPFDWHGKEQASAIENLFKCLRGPILILILEERH